MAIDLKFTQDANGEFDIDFESGDFKMTNGLDTALYMSVFGEKRATAFQVSEPSLRRGHFSNEFNVVGGYEVGSLFWLYSEQAKNIEKNLRLIETSIGNSLKWLIDDKIVSKINVSAAKNQNNITINIEVIDRLKNSKYYDLFLATVN